TVSTRWDGTSPSTIRMPNTEFTSQAEECLASLYIALNRNILMIRVEISQRKFSTRRMPFFATRRFILRRSAWPLTGNLRLVPHATSRQANNCEIRLGALRTKKHLQMATCCEDSVGPVQSLTAPVRRGH